MQDASNSKQLIAEKIKQSANILVTVNSSPSVDALTAALALALMLNKLDKHATAVFSGVIPPAINFLEPNKTFENNVDSLRDFIIALDKDKADRLRYKVEDDVVRIFITPYRTKISQSDLQFSQGDFNVDLIVALGVEDQRELDQAITAHGRILHDATVVTINAAAQKSSLGSIDWQDRNASSLSEMLAGMADMLKPGILDQQISTALLTGIVASTDRFSNQHTTPHVMTIAAQLMASGANQQLIATKLQSIPAPVSPRREKPRQAPVAEPSKKVSAENAGDGEMHIDHHKEKPQPAPLPMESAEPPARAPEPKPEPELEPEPEPELPIAPPPAQNFDDLKQAIKEETIQTMPQREMVAEPPAPGGHNINGSEDADETPQKSDEDSYLTSHPSWQGREIKPPSMGGTLNATAEQALQDKVREEADQRNRTILTHGGESSAPNQSQQQGSSSSGSSRRKKKNKGQGGGQQGGQSQGQGQQNQGQGRNQVPRQTPAASAPAPAPTPPPEPIPPAQPKPAPAPPMPEPTPPVEPAPEPEPQPVEPVPVVEPSQPVVAPVAPPEPAAPPEIPVAPPPLVVSEPLTPAVEPTPAPEVGLPSTPPASTPEPVNSATVAHEPTLEELEREAANHAAQLVAPQTLSELEAARQQADAAFAPSAPQVGPAGPAPQPVAPQPSPQPQSEPVATGLPPLPPMPDFSTLPPVPGIAPELPPQPLQQPMAPQQPQPLAQPPAPATPPPAPSAPPDPAQFRIPGQ